MFCPAPIKPTGPSQREQTNMFCFSLKIGIVPHPLQIRNCALSERSIIDSFKKSAMPWPTIVSRSISPIRKPPCAPRPPVGWCVFCSLRPSARAFHLSSTMCFRRIANTGPINMFVGIWRPDSPSYMISFPPRSIPNCFSKIRPIASGASLSLINNVASPTRVF